MFQASAVFIGILLAGIALVRAWGNASGVDLVDGKIDQRNPVSSGIAMKSDRVYTCIYPVGYQLQLTLSIIYPVLAIL